MDNESVNFLNSLMFTPEELGVDIDNEGWASFESVCSAFLFCPEKILALSQYLIIREARGVLKINESAVRSSGLAAPGEPSQPPEILYFGMPVSASHTARAAGLQPLGRTHVRLFRLKSDALRTVNRAAGDATTVGVCAGDLHRAGFKFNLYNGLWLVSHVPKDYIAF